MTHADPLLHAILHPPKVKVKAVAPDVPKRDITREQHLARITRNLRENNQKITRDCARMQLEARRDIETDLDRRNGTRYEKARRLSAEEILSILDRVFGK